MGRCNCNAESLSTCGAAEMVGRSLLDCEISRVSQLCRRTVAALSAFSALLLEDARHVSESKSGLGSELETAKIRLDRSLVLARAEPCRSLSDAQAKCLVFQCLTASFPETDCRVNTFARDLVYDVTELLHTKPSASQIENPCCSTRRAGVRVRLD